jgi:hypothetical protein
MAAFSTISGLIITAETTVIPDDGRALRHAEGGEIRGRNAYSETLFRINVVAKGNVAVKQALEAFYVANTDDMNTITIDDSNYFAMFSRPPAVTSKDGDIRWLNWGLLGFEYNIYGVEAVSGVGSVTVVTA